MNAFSVGSRSFAFFPPGSFWNSRRAFFSRFGREKLYGMHLNDSKVPLSSRKDRHESLGKGLIGLEPFMEIVRMDEVQGLPLVLETPDESAWAEEIRTLLEA